MAEVGKFNLLTVLREVEFGFYLDGEDLGAILLPKTKAPKDLEVGSQLRVFIYFDSEDRIIATVEEALACVGDFAYLKVAETTNFGAFLDWGLPKDLLVPFSEQKYRMQDGVRYLVYIYVDTKTNRIVATSKLGRYLNHEPNTYQEGDEVDLIMERRTDLGYTAIINKTHTGVVYSNEVFQDIFIGQQIKGYIKKIRPDGKIDLSLNKQGYERIDEVSRNIYKIIAERGGSINVTDKTAPDVLYDLFEVSKKSYKKAIGALYKKRLIAIEETRVVIIADLEEQERIQELANNSGE